MEPQIRLLGSCQLSDLDGRRIGLPTRKSWGLLAYLSQARTREVPREELAALLWPRGNEAQARASLRQELAVLRRSLAQAGVAGIRASKDRVRFTPPRGMIDTEEIDLLLAQNDRAAWRAGVALYSGNFLSDLKVRAGPFEEWVWIERQRQKARVVAVLQKLLDHDLAGEDVDRAMATAGHLLRIEPTQETAYRAMMRLYRRTGRRSEALQLFRLCADTLRRELDAEPSLETVSLAEQIRDETGRPAGRPQPVPDRQAAVVICLYLAGAADLASPHDPGDLARGQERFMTRAERVVAACGGTLVPGLGDRVLAVFGPPALGEGGEDSAVQAALSLCAEPVGLSDRAVLWPRAGLARGDVLVTPPPWRGHGGVLAGDAVLRAGILAQMARGGQVIAAQSVVARLNGGFDLAGAPVAVPELAEPGQVIRRVRAAQ